MNRHISAAVVLSVVVTFASAPRLMAGERAKKRPTDPIQWLEGSTAKPESKSYDELTKRVVAKLMKRLPEFQLTLVRMGKTTEESRTLVLSVMLPTKEAPSKRFRVVNISKEQAKQLIEYLAECEFLYRAESRRLERSRRVIPLPPQNQWEPSKPYYIIRIGAGELYETYEQWEGGYRIEGAKSMLNRSYFKTPWSEHARAIRSILRGKDPSE